MSRRTRDSAQAAAAAASEAAKVLQARGQVDTPEPSKERAEIKILTPRNEPRRRAMEEIEARDLKSKGIEPVEPEPKEEPKEEPKDEPEAPKVESAPEPTPETPEVPEAPKTVKVKVDGEEFDAPADEVEASGGVKAYQILKASENRLKKSNDVLAEARRFFEDAKKQTPAKPEITDDQFIASKMDEIRFGTPEQGAAAMREILQRATDKNKVDPNAIIDQATNRMRHDQAVSEFDKEYADIVKNPLLLELVVTLRNKRIANLNGPVDWNSFYRTIGNEVRSVAGRPSQPATTLTSGTPSQSPSEKEARKASIVNLPTAAARASLPEEEKQLSPEEARKEALNQMKKARGIPTG